MIGELWMGCQREVACQDVHLRRCVFLTGALQGTQKCMNFQRFPSISDNRKFCDASVRVLLDEWHGNTKTSRFTKGIQ